MKVFLHNTPELNVIKLTMKFWKEDAEVMGCFNGVLHNSAESDSLSMTMSLGLLSAHCLKHALAAAFCLFFLPIKQLKTI